MINFNQNLKQKLETDSDTWHSMYKKIKTNTFVNFRKKAQMYNKMKRPSTFFCKRIRNFAQMTIRRHEFGFFIKLTTVN